MPGQVTDVKHSLNDSGFELREHVVDVAARQRIVAELESEERYSSMAGIRRADAKLTSVAQWLQTEPLMAILSDFSLAGARLLRAIVFNKSSRSNWLVPWHQDRTIAVDKRFSAPGWGPWSVKDGVLHVEAPVEFLAEMLTIRIHLDDAATDNGCLKVLPRSHHRGKLTRDQINTLLSQTQPHSCVAPAGSALLMRPLLLHASNRMQTDRSRRVLHLEFSRSTVPD